MSDELAWKKDSSVMKNVHVWLFNYFNIILENGNLALIKNNFFKSLSFNIFYFLYVCLSICLSNCLPVCLSACMLYVCLSVCLSLCLSVCKNYIVFCPSVCLSVCLFVCLDVFFCFSETVSLFCIVT